ncbi:winged helix-turn-helix domain-containing protein [uncultured Mucilaginibacter sp.]|uniref:winged helix-turn-helix domain-containing protein n=1 Tax=uncultured Mucilaginibacter sp. TaxID=797541 RepID=UPI0025F2DF03|nr:winged helix-turn-helix domain-containing protein [uncultured Mucilaginibacter sp.]
MMTTPLNTLNSQSKVIHPKNQKKTIFHYLQDNSATASMIAKATGIPQKNICRYKRDLEKAGLLKELYKSICKETGFKAWYLTTNILLFPATKERCNNGK